MKRSFFLGLCLLLACSGAPVAPQTSEENSESDQPAVGSVIQVELRVLLSPPPQHEGSLFLLGWKQVDDRSRAPERNTRPDFLPRLLGSELTEAELVIEDFSLKAGVSYYAQYGEGMEPGPGFRTSEPTVPSNGMLELLVTGRLIPSEPTPGDRE